MDEEFENGKRMWNNCYYEGLKKNACYVRWGQHLFFLRLRLSSLKATEDLIDASYGRDSTYFLWGPSLEDLHVSHPSTDFEKS